MKCCRICGESKPLDDFGKTKKSKDGRDSQCKSCKNIASRKHYDLNSDRIKKQQRESYEVHKERKDVSVRKYQADNTNKVRAHRMINDAIRRGKISPLPCQICGNLVARAHHDDYSKPMQVRWLCAKHHAEWHRSNGEAPNGK